MSTAEFHVVQWMSFQDGGSKFDDSKALQHEASPKPIDTNAREDKFCTGNCTSRVIGEPSNAENMKYAQWPAKSRMIEAKLPNQTI